MSVTAKKHKPQKSAYRENAYTPKKNALWKIFGSEFSGTTTNFDQKPQCLRLENAPFTYDTASDVHFYGYRYYSSELGRWLNRDPMEEYGGVNLYVAFRNNSISSIDPLGLYVTYDCRTFNKDTKLAIAAGLWLEAGLAVSVKKCKCCGNGVQDGEYKEISASTYAVVGVGVGAKFKFWGIGFDLLLEGPHAKLDALSLDLVFNECTSNTDRYAEIKNSLGIAPGTGETVSAGIGGVSVSGSLAFMFLGEQRLILTPSSGTYEADVSVDYNVSLTGTFLGKSKQLGWNDNIKISPTKTVSF